MEWLLGIAGGLMLGGMLAGAVAGTIVPLLFGLAAGGLVLWLQAAAAIRRKERERRKQLACYPKYRY